jgi:hypothetical protein
MAAMSKTVAPIQMRGTPPSASSFRGSGPVGNVPAVATTTAALRTSEVFASCVALGSLPVLALAAPSLEAACAAGAEAVWRVGSGSAWGSAVAVGAGGCTGPKLRSSKKIAAGAEPPGVMTTRGLADLAPGGGMTAPVAR